MIEPTVGEDRCWYNSNKENFLEEKGPECSRSYQCDYPGGKFLCLTSSARPTSTPGWSSVDLLGFDLAQGPHTCSEPGAPVTALP